jgi:predicted nucleotidyltransferase
MASTDLDELAGSAAAGFARGMVPRWQVMLGNDLLGVYLIGSLAHGGFSRRYSDIDLAVVAEAGLSVAAIDQVKREATALSAEWGPKLSVFWADRYFSVGRFPPLDRLDYIDFSVVLMERERVRPARPTLDDIRLYLSGAPFANWAERARQFAAATALDPKDRKPYLRALLYPARFCYGYIAGRMGSSDDAVAFLHECPPSGLDLITIDRALQCRRSADDPDSLFVLRSTLPALVEACAAVIAGSSAPT